jgi:Tol biopolymer transport system component
MQEVVRKKMGIRRAIILLGVAMALLFSASALVPTEPSAQTTSPEGKIVFVKQGTEPSDDCPEQFACDDLWVMDADGTNQTNLTNTPDTNESQPAWSPDGTKIAFTGPGAPNEEGVRLGDVYVMDADGTNRTNLTDTPNRRDYQPSWAPSGEQLTFVREVEGRVFLEQPDIFVMDADPATNDDAINLTQTDESESHPDWSPDGGKIAFSGVRNSGWEIATMDPDGNNEAILTGDGFDGNDEAPDWSPDGTMVVFQKESQVGGCCEPWEIWAVNRDGSGDTNLTHHPSYDMGPSWSPDGTEITFTSTRARTEVDPSRTDIFTMPAPTTLPPATSEPAATTTLEQGEGVMTFAKSTLSTTGTACTLTGTSGADVLTGTSGADVICGGGGADLIKGRDGNDTLKGAGGADTLYGGLGKDELRGGKGTDSLVGGGRADSFFGGDNADVLNSRDVVSGNDVLKCGSGTDTRMTDATEKTIVSCEVRRLTSGGITTEPDWGPQ